MNVENNNQMLNMDNKRVFGKDISNMNGGKTHQEMQMMKK